MCESILTYRMWAMQQSPMPRSLWCYRINLKCQAYAPSKLANLNPRLSVWMNTERPLFSIRCLWETFRIRSPSNNKSAVHFESVPVYISPYFSRDLLYYSLRRPIFSNIGCQLCLLWLVAPGFCILIGRGNCWNIFSHHAYAEREIRRQQI